MKVKYLKSWNEFLNEASKIEARYGSSVVFRGHNDSKWKLETTLERHTKHQFSIIEYYKLVVNKVKPQLYAYTGLELPVDTVESYEEYLSNEYESIFLEKDPGSNAFVYARHHGFPSPLLDWTSSKHIASFFAFRNNINTRYVSIYVYCEMPAHSIRNQNNIYPIRQTSNPHKRHFIQQSAYTFCAYFDKEKSTWIYMPHTEAYKMKAMNPEESNQDLLWKFNIPMAERDFVLKQLNMVNINAYTLFGNEESLMETLAYQELPIG